MSQPVYVEISPGPSAVHARSLELLAANPALGRRLTRLREFARTVRTAEVFLTDTCNLRCRGCWFFEHDLDKAGGREVSDLGELRQFAERLRDNGITHVLLLGGEPALVPDRIRVFAETLPYVTVVTNGTRKVPRDGLENINIAVSLWGGGPLDDELRGHRPNGSRWTGLMDRALRNYQDDLRAVWIYTISEPGLPYIEETVRRIAESGGQVNFGVYSEYGADDPIRISEGNRLVTEMERMRRSYPRTVIGNSYYYRALVTGATHWGKFGYATCPSISVNHPAHTDRIAGGHPVLPGFNTYRSDHSIQFCCTSGDCDNCRDSQALWTWILVNMHRFLADESQLELWVELAESFFRQFYWSPFHPAKQRAAA
jgi:hypothetical protein